MQCDLVIKQRILTLSAACVLVSSCWVFIMPHQNTYCTCKMMVKVILRPLGEYLFMCFFINDLYTDTSLKLISKTVIRHNQIPISESVM